MRTILFTFLLSLLLHPMQAQFRPLEKRNHVVNSTLKELLAFPGFRTAGLAFLAVDIRTGETVASVNPDMALRPASTMKLLTTATSLELLGTEKQFETTLGYSGRIDSGRHLLEGHLVIRGFGDPSLGSSYLEDTDRYAFLEIWTGTVEALSIDSITGSVTGDAGYFSWEMIPATWSWGNMGQYYGAGPSGLALFDNAFSVFFETGDRPGLPARIQRIEPELPKLRIDNRVVSDSIGYDNAYIFGAPYSFNRYIRGELPLNRSGFEVRGSLPDPPLTAALLLDSCLREAGIHTGAPPTTMRRRNRHGWSCPDTILPVRTALSPPLKELIRLTNTHSINLFAEHLLLHAGISLGAFPETAVAADSMVAFWEGKGMDTEGLAVTDGSGLSQYNAVTPRQLVWLLTWMRKESAHRHEFYNSLAVAGESGTLEPLFKGTIAQGKLRAKSGTISRVKAYAGYVTSVSGREIAFSMVVNNFSCTSARARDRLEELMVALAELDK